MENNQNNNKNKNVWKQFIVIISGIVFGLMICVDIAFVVMLFNLLMVAPIIYLLIRNDKYEAKNEY